MSEKSYVSIEQHICMVCGVPFDTGAILINRRMRPCMERTTVNGLGLCPEHERPASEGLVALVECDVEHHGSPDRVLHVTPEQLRRTGRVVYLSREVCAKVFGLPIPSEQACVLVAPGAFERLRAMAAQHMN